MSRAPCSRVATAAALALALVLATAEPAAAHGVGGRTDLPLPLWMFTYGAAAALIVSFVALRALWRKPRLERLAAGRPLPEAADRLVPIVEVVLRAAGLAAWALALVAAWFGRDTPAGNITPLALYVVLWVGVPVAVVLLGDLWRFLSPFDTLALVADRLGGRTELVDRAPHHGHWPAVAFLGSFLWLELAYFDSGRPSAIAVWLTLYSVAALGGAAAWGRGWLRHAEGFAVLLTLLGHLGIFFRHEGRLRIRPPLVGLGSLVPVAGTAAVVLVVLGGTSFDGLTRSEWWVDLAGSRREWSLTFLNTIGLVWVVAVMAVAYLLAIRGVARIGERDAAELADRFVPSLVPIMFAYGLAHYFSLLVLEGQDVVRLLSDPLGQGWDVFGTAGNRIDYTAVSPTTIAWVQAGAIVLGHVAGVVAAHDKAVSLWRAPRAERTQYPLLAVMIAYTVGGLALLLGT